MDSSNLLQLAKKTFSIEIDELENKKNTLDDNFINAVQRIFNSKGKLVIVGIGKSAHVATKIVATLNSTGTRTQFLHASEAIHGDLGLIQKEDVILCISNSGNSPEIVRVTPLLKSYSSCLIAMTGNTKSKLAEAADIIIDSSISQEACPMQLAPTSSTTVQMVLGDALAICLMELRKFNENDFAKYHPGGNLGKNLTAIVGQYLSNNKPEVTLQDNIRNVIISISSSKHGITAVTDGQNVVGVITDGDLRRMLLKNEDISKVVAADIMSSNPKTIDKNVLAKNAMDLMKENNIGQLLVTENGKYVGIIDLHKLLDDGII